MQSSAADLILVERERRRRRTVALAPCDSPLAWAIANATIVHPALGRIPFAPYPYQERFLTAHDQPRRIVVKARQIGFSQAIALEALYYALHQGESTIILVSRNQDMATNLLRYCYQTYNGLRQAPELVKANESEMGFPNGSRIKSVPANRSTGRGFAATRVYLDEFAFAPYAEDIYQSVSPAVSQGGHLTIGSTPYGNTNLFASLYRDWSDPATAYLLPWTECPAYYTPDERSQGIAPTGAAWYQRERPRYTAAQWAEEYDADFSGSGDNVFQPAVVAAAEEGATGEAEPVTGRRYVVSVDVGRRNDPTVINAIDVTDEPYQRVYHERLERTPYPVIQQRIAAVGQRYPGKLLVESNGIGDPVIENLDGVVATPFVTTSKSKVQAIQALALLLEQGLLKAQWTDQERRELRAYRWDDRNLVQDCVMSLAIAAPSLGAPAWLLWE
jgi:hypothetical protein